MLFCPISTCHSTFCLSPFVFLLPHFVYLITFIWGLSSACFPFQFSPRPSDLFMFEYTLGCLVCRFFYLVFLKTHFPFFPLYLSYLLCLLSYAFLILHLHEYLDCRWSFVLTGSIYTVEYEHLGSPNTPNDIKITCKRAIKDKLWDGTAGTPKRMLLVLPWMWNVLMW